MAKGGAKGGARRIGVWVILILLFVGLIGFGATGLSGRITTLATVGEKEIRVTDYARELNGQMDAFSAQMGQRLSFPEAQRMGLDQFALQQLVASRALDNEATQIGLSVGDAAVAEQVLAIPAFQSANGFNREAYAFALEREGYSETEFEERLREDIARSFLQGAVVSGVPAPQPYARALAAFVGEERDIRYVLLTGETLETPPAPPTQEELAAYHEENAERFTAPEVRSIDYAWLTPEMIQDDVTVDETALEELYQDRIDTFVQPERRLVERLVMPDAEAAEAALAQIDAGGATFDTLVTGRGLALADVDLGDVTEDDLDAAGPEVFAAEVGEVVGPLPSDFGPALYRINAVFDAQETSFEEALPELREELAAARARRVIDDARDGIADLIAGGAGVADLAENTEMEAGQIAWSVEVSDGIAAYAAFREAAATTEPGALPELRELEDGGLFVLEVTDITPPTLRPLDEVADAVSAAWMEEATARALEAEAERMAARVAETGGFTDDMPAPVTETGLSRRSVLPDAPSGLVEQVFAVAEGGVAMASEGATVALALVDAVRAPSTDDEAFSTRASAIGEQAGAAIAEDLMAAFMTRVQEQTEVSIDQAAVSAVHAQMQ